jgi:NAD(P)-dependent dehydrogenase (short-subunit alcohol dehydrogenase family)/acyl carrier protein
MAKARHIGRVAITHPAPGQPRARADASYLVTGGLGALGLHIAEWLAGQGAGHIVLMGRSAPSEGALRRIAEIAEGGTVVEVVAGDVSRPADLQFLSEGGRPPLRGVVHAAGIVDDATLGRLDAERLERALRPKADGALNLMRATAGVQPDFVVLFSSGSAVLGSPGQATYSAANAFMDGFAHRLRADGVPAVSINWGAWEGGGMAAQVDERTEREWAARGVSMLGTDTALRLLDNAIASGLPQVAALPIAWAVFLRRFPPDRIPRFLCELSRGIGTPPAVETNPADVASAQETIRALPAHERLTALSDRLRRETAAVMGAQRPEDLELGVGLMEQGMDSLMAVELSGRLGRVLGVSLPTTFAFEHPTLSALARHLMGQIVPEAADDVVEAPVRAALQAEPVSNLNDLSDDELEAELRRELDQAGF